MAIDNRTTGRNYPLPHPSNLLAEDVQRLRDALIAIDGDVVALDQLIDDVVNGAPEALNTLNELAAALNDDANFAATVTTALNNRYTKAESDARYVQGVTQTENVFTGNGSHTAFTLTQTPPTRESLLVTVDGVVQPTTAYNISGTSLILSEAPASGARIRVLMQGIGPVQSASTLSFTQAGPGAVTRTVDSKLKDVVNVKDFGAVGDGVADDTAAVLAAISSGGRQVWFPAGTYIVTYVYVSGLSGILIAGVPGQTTIKKKAGTYGVNVDGAISGIFDFVQSSCVTLSGLKFDGNKANALPSGGTHLNGVNFYLCTLTRVENCEFVNVEFQGLNHQCTNQSWVTNNKFIACGWSGVGFTGGYFATYNAESCVIADNYFESIWAGVQCQISTVYVNVKNNRFRNSSLVFAQDVRYATISGNTFDGAAPSGALGEAPQDAITIESDYNITITGNTINAPARHGIYVVGNYIENGPSEGILTCNDVVIDGNVITNTVGQGIQFDPGSAFTYNMGTHIASPATESNYTYAKNGVLANNIISESGGGGIVLGICQNVQVEGNIISRSTTHGITVGSSKSVFIRGNSIRNSSKSAADTYDGISLSASVTTLQNIIIESNAIFDDQAVRTQRYGIHNPNAAAELQVFNNIFKNNGTNLSSVITSLPFVIQNSPTFQNGASPFGSGFETPGYYMDSDGIVHLRGIVQLGSSGVGNAMFTLPAGMRPRYDEMFTVLANSSLGRCDVKATGEVVAVAATNSQWVNLSGISFAANR